MFKEAIFTTNRIHIILGWIDVIVETKLKLFVTKTMDKPT